MNEKNENRLVEKSNYISHGGKYIKKERPFLGCLTLMFFLAAGAVGIFWAFVLAGNSTRIWSGQTPNPVLFDGRSVYEFELPAG
ncbi:MAG TPA: hypothetical protein ENN55_01265, partial [Firmicutes bacterium]|nr:hypothetical protein [Bacillota bacterium]